MMAGISTLDFTLGSVRLNGGLTLDPASRAAKPDARRPQSRRSLGAGADQARRPARCRIALAAPGRQDIDLTARGSAARWPSLSIDKFDARANAKDIYGRPMLDAAIAIDRAVAAGEAISGIRFDLKGRPTPVPSPFRPMRGASR
jgi:translocation and assembly module TamB